MAFDKAPIEIALAAAVAAALFAAARPANAHVMGLSRGEYFPEGTRLRAEITLRAEDARLAVPGLDADGDGQLSNVELARGAEAIEMAFFEPLRVRAGSAPCRPALEQAVLEPPDGVRFRATYACAQPVGHLVLGFGFLDRMASGHRHLATVHLPRGDVDALAVDASTEMAVDAAEPGSHGFGSLWRAGVEHILTGADHLAFLLALVLGGVLAPLRGLRAGPPRVAPLVAMLTAFTVGHSVSLAASTLWGLAPGPRLVEPAVALSVAYIGAENLFARSVDHRWLLTFPFGLVHGFAFAGGLLPLGVPRAELPIALLAFNLGVEAGQLVILGALWPAIAWLGRRPFFTTAARAVSAGIVLAGLTWFFQRIA